MTKIRYYILFIVTAIITNCAVKKNSTTEIGRPTDSAFYLPEEIYIQHPKSERKN